MELACTYDDPLLHIHHATDRHPNDGDFVMHVHEQFEIYYFISGDAHYLVEGSEYPLEPGCLLIMRPLETHKVKILGDKAYERYSLSFSPEVLNIADPDRMLLVPFLNHPLGQSNLYRPAAFKGEQPLELFESMCAPVPDEGSRRLEILIHLYPLLGVIRRAFLQKQAEDDGTVPSPAEEIVGYINRHLFDDLSLDFLADRFFLSTSQLGRLFRQVTGSSVWEYITIKRLMAAHSKIKGGVSATAACQECGFGDYSAFYRAYVKRFGRSPKQDAPG